ncbi:hypothetical protein POVWA2_012220 [Plasmodium ovale wallikeri]|uniref:Uncharacterized protein n=1 Tax=Plasmodium ovale wallikeri TaxID=864142 RepID=A0A1A8YNH1_PLAOA|nr:hypothetical protein POVWA2_012220 [Plasmodium ovale wallikeri]
MMMPLHLFGFPKILVTKKKKKKKKEEAKVGVATLPPPCYKKNCVSLQGKRSKGTKMGRKMDRKVAENGQKIGRKWTENWQKMAEKVLSSQCLLKVQSNTYAKYVQNG